MAYKRVAVVQPIIIPGGGTESVTAWTIEALKTRYSVTLLSFSNVDVGALNSFYGTELKKDEFMVVQPRLLPFLSWTNRFAVLKDHLMMRYCKSVNADFDLFVGVGGGMDFGRRGIQYGAYAPASTLLKVLGHDAALPPWYYLAKKSMMRFCESISGFSGDSLKSNVTLATSRWIGERMEEMYSIHDYEIVYPPVKTPSADTPWELRREGFLCIARITPGKQIEQAIEILQLVRDKGFDVSLHIIGRPDDRRYFNKINAICAENPSWISLHGLLGREELSQLIDQNKYGINAAADEPFGIAVAEMVKAGAIVFVSNGGGQTEIVDTPQLIYDGIEDAVEKISRVLKEESLQRDLLRKLQHQSSSFSTQGFCDGIRNAVGAFFSQQVPV